MRIAYVFHRDAADPAVQSGRPASVLQGFEGLGHEIERIFPLTVPTHRAELAKKVGYRLIGKHHRNDRDPDYLTALAGQCMDRLAGREYDFLFSPGSESVSHLPASVPIAFCADATFANLVDYYWDFTGLSEEYRLQGHAQEAAALQRAMLAVYPSDWAARSAIEHYGTDPERVAVIPFGANLGGKNRRGVVHQQIARRSTERLRLLFVGRHWGRKGGETVIATALCLIAHGHPLTLDLVGCEAPAAYRGLPWINHHGRLDRNQPADMKKLRALFAGAHFLFMPSQAEAFGLTLAEAHAFGTPVIATRTGGITSLVQEGRTGWLLPTNAKASDYADLIIATFTDPPLYRAMCHDAFAEFQERLNWRTFCREFIAQVQLRLERIERRRRSEHPFTATTGTLI
jgi:glycosyltransferase involved in cell wall biosynthesis